MIWNFLKIRPSSCPIIHGMLSLFATMHGPVRQGSLLDDRNRIAWNPNRRRVYAVMGMSRPSTPVRVRERSTFFAESSWLPTVPTVNQPRTHFLTGRPRVAAHLLFLRSVRRRTMDSGRDKRTPVPSGS